MRSILFPILTVFALACAGDSKDTDTGAESDTDTDTDTDTDSDTDTDTDTDTDSDTDTDTDTGVDPVGCQTDICVTYGAAVPTVASQITDAAATDPEFADDFAGLVARGPDAVDAFKTSLANFITDAYGCTTGAYTGPTMVEAHTGLGITQQEYDDFIVLIAGVLASDGVPEADINECFAPPLVDPAFTSQFIGL